VVRTRTGAVLEKQQPASRKDQFRKDDVLTATPSPLCCSGGGRRDQYCITVPYGLVPQSLNLNAMGMSMYLLFALFMSCRNSGMQVAQPPQYSINQKVVFFF